MGGDFGVEASSTKGTSISVRVKVKTRDGRSHSYLI